MLVEGVGIVVVRLVVIYLYEGLGCGLRGFMGMVVEM